MSVFLSILLIEREKGQTEMKCMECRTVTRKDRESINNKANVMELILY